ncbi:hypothetical protein PAHAL_6G073500 [Panicum hallii]|uniref:Uncharacterized protein n=1 Tax=Panicum hallii TaxID=206008 RepID=A0A2T8IFN4_9POAL|nr:hypothetical protein PAHAL_6G073500 [Panicum hallii]
MGPTIWHAYCSSSSCMHALREEFAIRPPSNVHGHIVATGMEATVGSLNHHLPTHSYTQAR